MTSTTCVATDELLLSAGSSASFIASGAVELPGLARCLLLLLIFFELFVHFRRLRYCSDRYGACIYYRFCEFFVYHDVSLQVSTSRNTTSGPSVMTRFLLLEEEMLNLLSLCRPTIERKQRASLLLAVKKLVRSIERRNILQPRTRNSNVVDN